MQTDNRPVRVVKMSVRQALGLTVIDEKTGKPMKTKKGEKLPDLETVLNRLWVRGYVPLMGGVSETGALFVVCVNNPPVTEEVVVTDPLPAEDGLEASEEEEEEEEEDDTHELGTPEVITAA